MVEIACNTDYRFTSFAWGPLDKSIYACTTNGRVMQYDASNGKQMQEEQVHTDNIYCINFTHDFTMLSTGSHDNTAKVLDPKTLKEIRVFTYGKPVRSAVISPLFDDPEHQKFHLITGGGQDAKDVTTTAASEGGFDMKMYSVIFNEQLAEIGGHFGPIHSIDFS